MEFSCMSMVSVGISKCLHYWGSREERQCQWTHHEKDELAKPLEIHRPAPEAHRPGSGTPRNLFDTQEPVTITSYSVQILVRSPTALCESVNLPKSQLPAQSP